MWAANPFHFSQAPPGLHFTNDFLKDNVKANITLVHICICILVQTLREFHFTDPVSSLVILYA